MPAIVHKICNKDEFTRILLFDHVIFNTDRNPGNLLVRFYKKDLSLKLIDHTHVFINQALWDKWCLKRAMEENDLIDTRILENNSYLYEMFFRDVSITITKEIINKEMSVFKNKINSGIINRIISDIPQEWKPRVDDIEELVKYIFYRVDNLETIIVTILKYINR